MLTPGQIKFTQEAAKIAEPYFKSKDIVSFLAAVPRDKKPSGYVGLYKKLLGQKQNPSDEDKVYTNDVPKSLKLFNTLILKEGRLSRVSYPNEWCWLYIAKSEQKKYECMMSKGTQWPIVNIDEKDNKALSKFKKEMQKAINLTSIIRSVAKEEEEENISAVKYSEAAERFELRLGKYLRKDPRGLDAVSKLLKIYINKYTIEDNIDAYGSDDASMSGVVGKDVKTLLNVANNGSLREKLTMVELFSYHVMGKNKLNPKGKDPESFSDMGDKADKYMEGVVDNFYRNDRLKKTPEQHSHVVTPGVPDGRRTYNEAKFYFESQGMQNEEEVQIYLENLQNLEELEAKMKTETDKQKIDNLKKEKSKLKKRTAKLDKKFRENLTPGVKFWDIKMGTEFQHQGNDRSVKTVAGPSGTTRVLMTVAKEVARASKDLLINLRLAILGIYLTEGHHSFHEIMMVSKAFGLNYTDTDERYVFIDPLTELELRKNVAENGLFPHEIGKSLQG